MKWIDFSLSINLRKFLPDFDRLAKKYGVKMEDMARILFEEIKKRGNKYLREGARPKGSFEDKNWATIESSWYLVRQGKEHWLVENIAPHARYVEYGTGIYAVSKQGRGTPITPIRAKVLRFKWYPPLPPELNRGGYVFIEMVRGQEPKGFFSKAIASVRKDKDKMFEKYFQNIR